MSETQPSKQFLNISLRRWLTLSIAVVAISLAAWVLIGLRGDLESEQVSNALRSISTGKLAFAAIATALSFVTLAAMEMLGARHYVNPSFPLRTATLFSLIVYGISNTFGFAGLASTPLRIRLYADEGAKTDRILSLCLLASAAFWIGLALLLGICLMISAGLPGRGLDIAPAGLFCGGLVIFAAALFACYFLGGRGTKAIANLELSFPDSRSLLLQVTLAALDWALAGIALYSLLPNTLESNVFRFMSGFLLSQVAALVSSIPGGIGVLEGFNLYMMNAPKDTLHHYAAAFIAYRSLYYLPPLVLAFALFAAWSMTRAKGTFTHAARAVGTYGRGAAPLASSLLAGAIGMALLLNSGQAFSWLTHWSLLPPFWESLIGTALLILAIGLYERSSSARKITLFLTAALVIGAAFHGMVIVAFAIATTLIGLLLVSGREFYRKRELSSLRIQQRFSLLVLLPTLASMVLAIVAFYRHELGHQQWWQFTFDPNASGFLRGCVGSLVTLGAYGLWALLSPRGQPKSLQSVTETKREERDIAAILSSPFTTAWLALVGDKDIYRKEGIDGFVMYKVIRPYWIAMSEPVCTAENSKRLIEAFLDDCDRHGGVPVFYQTRPETLARYVEIGFQAVKIGEEARVHLPNFSLEGRERKSMRNTCSRIEREGYQFSLLTKEVVPTRLSELRRVSDEWLKSLSMREKRFSIGYFNDHYLSMNDVAIITKGDRLIAFANLWITGKRDEFSVDLMRYGNDAPSGVMEYLIIQLMLHAKSEGYQWFNLGMAPLAGLEGIHSGRQWHRVGSLIYRAGEAFYNFRGLKSFKDKFGPTWESRFLVYPPGSNLARILSSVAFLINFRYVKKDQDRKAS